MMLVEALRRFVLGIYNHCEHSHLRPRGALQCIRKQNAAETKPLPSAGNGEPAKQGRRNHWIAWQFLNELRGKSIQGDAGCAQGVVSGDLSRIIADSDKTRSDPAPDVLGSLRLKISVERGGAAHESGSVVLVVERFNPKGLAHLSPDEIPVTRECFLQDRVQFAWYRQKLYELFLRLARQPNDLYFGYRFLRGLLGGSDDKIADRTPLDFGRATDDGKRFRCDACLQAGSPVDVFHAPVRSLSSVRHSTVQIKVRTSPFSWEKSRRRKPRFTRCWFFPADGLASETATRLTRGSSRYRILIAGYQLIQYEVAEAIGEGCELVREGAGLIPLPLAGALSREGHLSVPDMKIGHSQRFQPFSSHRIRWSGFLRNDQLCNLVAVGGKA